MRYDSTIDLSDADLRKRCGLADDASDETMKAVRAGYTAADRRLAQQKAKMKRPARHRNDAMSKAPPPRPKISSFFDSRETVFGARGAGTSEYAQRLRKADPSLDVAESLTLANSRGAWGTDDYAADFYPGPGNIGSSAPESSASAAGARGESGTSYPTTAAGNNVTQWVRRGVKIRDLRDAIYSVSGRLFPRLPADTRAQIAEFGAGIPQQKYEEFMQRAPSMPLNPPVLSPENQARLNACMRNLGDDLLDTYADPTLEK